jgi:photosystem II stability/assembly factor-like uncharacterized protein
MLRQFQALTVAIVLIAVVSCAAVSAGAQQVNPALFQEMKWRLVGPFRAGRSLTAVGVPGNPSLYYFGAVGGGVWKSTNAGATWDPIFDSQPIASIGAMAVAPSDPNVIYVGTGEADMREDITYGNGMYKSTDAGKTWTHIGLDDSQQIGRVLVDPKNPDVVYVAALGHAFGANAERGVFRTTDGGKTWQRVLHKDDDTGAIDLAFDPQDSKTIYASLWQTRRPPWNVYPPSNGPGSGLYKSTDGGTTWTHLTNGLPTEGIGRIGIAVAASDHNRVYAVVDAKQGGLYRSDDAGQSWKLMDSEQRIWGRGWYFGVVEADPKNADVVYITNTTVYKSTDGGHSFSGFKGAPGGDDYHSVWISPDNPQRMIISSDQGTIVTLNGGNTWSSWYNQPTAQLYHVSTDNRFPYWLYGAQQDSGAVAVPNRSEFASITERDWRYVAIGGESGMLAPDPVNTDIVFGGTVGRWDWRTKQVQDVSPTLGKPGEFRTIWTLPLVFSQADKSKLYFSHQMLFRTNSGGKTWDQISPDLTRENPPVPPNLDPITAKYGLASPRKGLIYAIAPSPIEPNTVWVGTDDGTIHLTLDDGKTWKDVTPPQLKPWSKVGIIEASHFDKSTAYAAIDAHRIEDMKPYIYRTRDGGQSWQLLGKGIPEGAFVNAVREDTVRRGLLFAGTELGVYVSFNDGDDWQRLQMNLPVASVRDLAVHDNDLSIATHGRSFWILDDIGPLREAEANISADDAYLFKPVNAMRLRPGDDQGTPYPTTDIPHGDNPPDGAVIDYYLKTDATTPVVLEVLDAKGAMVRRFATDDKLPQLEEKSLVVTMDWVKQPRVLPAKAGMHRWLWDLHYPAPSGATQRRRGGGGNWALPGQYTVRLTANGKTYSQPLTVAMDPRVKVAEADLAAQFEASQRAARDIEELAKPAAQAATIAKQINGLNSKLQPNSEAATTVSEFRKKFDAIVGPPPPDYGTPVVPVQTDHTSIRYLQGVLRQVQGALQSADAPPTPEQLTALSALEAQAKTTLAQWQQLQSTDLAGLNAKLQQAALPQINAGN